MIAFPNCKINLGLHILRKRPDGFHDLQTLFYPVPVCDGLEIITDPEGSSVNFSASGLPIDIAPDQNICVKAYRLLKDRFPVLPAVKMHLHKVIPTGAGLGGGSADGAFTLTLLNRKYSLGLDRDALLGLALQLGSDCPFFILNEPAFGEGRGEQLEPYPIDLSGYRLLLVNPGIPVHTGRAFSELQLRGHDVPLRELLALPPAQWKHHRLNDFEEPVFRQHPEMAGIKEALYEGGALFASMSGSGSTVYGLFPKQNTATPSFPAHYFVKSV